MYVFIRQDKMGTTRKQLLHLKQFDKNRIRIFPIIKMQGVLAVVVNYSILVEANNVWTLSTFHKMDNFKNTRDWTLQRSYWTLCALKRVTLKMAKNNWN